MKKNMGALDRALRIVIALVIAVLYYTGVISGTWATVLGIVAIAFVATSFFSFCPLYLPFGMNTFRKKKA